MSLAKRKWISDDYWLADEDVAALEKAKKQTKIAHYVWGGFSVASGICWGVNHTLDEFDQRLEKETITHTPLKEVQAETHKMLVEQASINGQDIGAGILVGALATIATAVVTAPVIRGIVEDIASPVSYLKFKLKKHAEKHGL